MLKKTRWLAAGALAVVATFAAPSRSAASVTILIQEIDAAGNVLPGAGNSQLFNSAAAVNVATTNFGQISVTAASNSATSSPTASVSTAFSFLNTSAISASDLNGLSLRITVTDTFDRPPGGLAGSINSSIGAANGSTGFKGVLDVSNQTDALSTGGTSLTTGSTPPIATAQSPSGTGSGAQFLNVGSLPQDFQIQQVITVKLSANGADVPSNQAFSGSVASGTDQPQSPPGPVPAPGGLLLALAAIPALGLRRVLRKRAAA
jgi:hypothetical protein